MAGSLEIEPKSSAFEEQISLFKEQQERMIKRLNENHHSSEEIKMKEKKTAPYTFFIVPGGDIINEIEEFAENKVPPNVTEI